ncbi:MAG: spore coat protein CotJB [Oscillospiraceae bacterium]|nr:spore coat protein CotJB [Oscillospiraceae bacterium]
MEDNKSALLRCLQELAFAVQESTLFLDTHPTDQQALAYHNEKLARFNEMKKRYVAQFGPLCGYTTTQESWRWIDNPWPWE